MKSSIPQRTLIASLVGLLSLWHAGAMGCQMHLQDLEFGTYDPSSNQPAQTQATWSIYCESTTSLTIEIEPSSNTVSSGARQLAHTSRMGEYMNYFITQDASNQLAWGIQNKGEAVNVTVSNNLRIPVYAVIPAKQDAWLGRYSDNITVQILP